MDKSVIRKFWTNRALSGSTRWTDNSILEFEVQKIRNHLGNRPRNRILDLGSGFGELSLKLKRADDYLLAVDSEPMFGSVFTELDGVDFVSSDVTQFKTEEKFDLVLLFGVVTHLTLLEEIDVYQKIASFVDSDGIAVIKNQCSLGNEFLVDAHSSELGTHYVGRYPGISEQVSRLNEIFSSIHTIEYPQVANRYSNSKHYMFICCANNN